MEQIRELATIDVEVARLLTGHTWMADSVTLSERASLAHLLRIAEYDPQLARSVLRQPFLETPFRHRDARAMSGPGRLYY